jgi:membrane protease YdiL (CAAX protease family)
MEELSTRQKTLLRVGLLVAILITLWMFGVLHLGSPVAYAPIAH